MKKVETKSLRNSLKSSGPNAELNMLTAALIKKAASAKVPPETKTNQTSKAIGVKIA